MSADQVSGGAVDGEVPVKIQYLPKPGLGALVIKNLFLNILTLFIYSFWAKTEVRKHIWSCVQVMDEPLEYTGRGLELFLGFIIVVFVIMLPLSALQTYVALASEDLAVSYLANTVSALIILFLVGVGTYRARRYRLSRTLWRGIRGTLTGSSWRYGAQSFIMLILLPLSLFWTMPWMNVSLTSRMTREMTFGSRPFSFSGGSGPLYKPFAIFWFGTTVFALPFLALVIYGLVFAAGSALLGDFGTDNSDATNGTLVEIIGAAGPILTIALAVPLFLFLRAFYTAAELNYLAACTSYENLRFRLQASAWSLVGLMIVNTLILLLSLGIAAPFVQQRLVRYLCDRLTVDGSLNVADILQAQGEADKIGEGIAEVFDIDAF